MTDPFLECLGCASPFTCERMQLCAIKVAPRPPDLISRVELLERQMDDLLKSRSDEHLLKKRNTPSG